jgi:hypothetical protein
VELVDFRCEIILTLLNLRFDFDGVVVLCAQRLLLTEEGFVGLDLLSEIGFDLFDADGTVQIISDEFGAECRWNVPFLADVDEGCDLK